MTKQKTTIQTETTVNEQDSPALIAYRVGLLEKAVANGFHEIKEELTSLRSHFVSVEMLDAAQKKADDVHKEHLGRIRKLEAWNEWAVKIVMGAVITAILALVLASKTIGI